MSGRSSVKERDQHLHAYAAAARLKPEVAAVEVLRKQLVATMKERDLALKHADTIDKSLQLMKNEANAQKQFITRLVSEKVRAETESITLLMSMKAAAHTSKNANPELNNVIGIYQRRLQDANAMITAHRASIARLREENDSLRNQSDRMEAFGLQHENLRGEYERVRQENEDLKTKLNFANEDNSILRMENEEMETRCRHERESHRLDSDHLQLQDGGSSKTFAVSGGEELAALEDDFWQSDGTQDHVL